jgi:hypothetical protein
LDDTSRFRDSFAAEIRGAALEAQELLIVTQALEGRVSSLSMDTPVPAVQEVVVLLKAAAVQLSVMLFGVVARAERIACFLREVPGGSSDGETASKD